MSRNMLRYIAMLTMLLDHISVLFLTPNSISYMILRYGFGRLAYPIFGILLIEGMFKINHPARHLIWLLICAILTEPAYDLVAFGMPIARDGQNILWLYLLVALFITTLRKNRYLSILPAIAACIICAFFHVEYGLFGAIGMLAAAIMIYLNNPLASACLVIGLFEVLENGHITALLPALICLAYHPEKSCPRHRILFYAYYPAHLYILYFLTWII